MSSNPFFSRALPGRWRLPAPLLIALPLLVALPGLAQPTRPARAEVTAATVFRDRAQLSAVARAIIDRGITEVVIGALPLGLDPATVQVGATTEAAEANLTLLGVQVRADYVSAAKPRSLALLEDSLHGYEAQVRALADQKELLQKEEAALAAALSQSKTDPDDLEENADLFRKRGADIRTQIRLGDARLQRLQPLVERWQQQIQTYEGARTTPPGQLVITLSAEQRTSVTLNLAYVVTDAGWEPVYDLRATSTGGPVQLTYKAAVHQNTGADWRNVRLVLSGGAPVVVNGSALPELQTAYVRINEPRPTAYRSKKAAAAEAVADEQQAGFSDTGSAEWGSPPPPPAAPPATTASRDGSAIRFELTNPFTVPADGRPHTVEVQKAELAATYGVTVVPKLDQTAFLTASLLGWGQYNLLFGRANTYLDGTFTGAFDLDPASAIDTLRLTLGPDRNVVVRREKSREFSRRALFGGTVTDAVAYVITARNDRKAAVNLRVEEQVPRAAESRISVEATELSGATLDQNTGRVTWRATLQPGETRAWKLGYEVKYPKKVSITTE